MLDRRPRVATFAVDALEGQVAADHYQRAAAGDEVANQRQAIRQRLRRAEGVRMKEKRVRADVAENDDVVRSQILPACGKSRIRLVIGQKAHFVPGREQRRTQPADPFRVSAGGEAVESL